MPEGKRAIRAEYVFPDGLRTVHADGVYGGWTPKKYLRMDFLVDLWTGPEAEVKDYDAEGKPAGETVREGVRDNVMTRESQVRVLMSEEAARSFFDWLQVRLKEVEKHV